jgi:probable poly-beta-1,6-N-acetyl-D-glucosamine export protein
MKNSRIYELDALRAFGFLFVVAQHLLGGFAWRAEVDTGQSLILSLFYVIAKPAVPIFLVLVGLTLFLYSKDQKPKFKEFYKKKFKNILIPYILWSLIIIIFNGDYQKFNNIIGILVTGSGNYHLWYMGVLIRVFLFFPLMWFIFNYSYSRGKAIRDISFALFVVVSWYLIKNEGVITTNIASFIFNNPSELEKKFVSISPIFWSLYLVIGMRIAYEYDNFMTFIETKKWNILGVYPFLLAYNYYDEIKDKIGIQESDLVQSMINYSHSVLYIAYMVLSILVFYIISKDIYAKLPRVYSVLRHIAKHSYVGYLIHTCVLSLSAMPILTYGMPYSLPLDTAIYVVTIFFSIEIPHMIGYLPFSYLLTGAPQLMPIQVEAKTKAH